MLTNLADWYNNLGPEAGMVVRATVHMLVGGVLAIYIRELYKKCGTSLSNRQNFANIFPVLTMVTVVIIFVVKSSLALSLGLVGALSIVRFRTAIKTPEELVYLFFCIGVGLTLGAEYLLLTVVAVAIVSVFILARWFFAMNVRRHNLLLTITGEAERFFEGSGTNVLDTIKNATKSVDIQRFDVEDGRVQFRAQVELDGPEATTALMSSLQANLPRLQVSYVNLDTLL
ncbi:MAG: DUF4956 domain-containing protein [Vicinamibacteria bacterium]